MKRKALMAGLVAIGGLAAQADVVWKYDDSGRTGKYVAPSVLPPAGLATAYEGRPWVGAPSPATVTLSGFFDTRAEECVVIGGLSLEFNAPGFLLFLR